MREIHYNEVLVSSHKGKKKTTTQRMETWVIGPGNTVNKINTNKEMLKQIEDHVYPKVYKGLRKVLVIKIISTKYLGDSFYYS